jgi:hypothetical protein
MSIVDPKVEDPTREMLELAIRGELQELGAQIQAVGGETYRHILALCLTAAAYIAVDVSGRWPTDADIRQIARNTVREETRLELGEEDVYDYLSGAALGFRPLAEAFGSDEAAALLPVLITASMLFTFRPKERKWWEYLDQIWNAYEVADRIDASAFPAVQVRSYQAHAAEVRGAGQPQLPARWRTHPRLHGLSPSAGRGRSSSG